MLLYLTRHGRTDYNARGLCQGQLDIPLNAEGKEQAQLLGTICKDIPFTKIYSSDLSRAFEASHRPSTAQAVADHHPHLQIEVCAPLRNQYWGSIQGHSYHLGDPIPDDVETQTALDARMRDWLKSMLEAHVSTSSPSQGGPCNYSQAEHESEVILAVSHEDCIASLRNFLLETDPSNKVVRTEIAPGLDITGRPTNSTLAKVRFWRDEGTTGVPSGVKARVEAWGSK